MAKWRIERERGVDPSRGRDTETAFAFHLRDDGEEVQTTVEYATGSGLGSMHAARDVLRPYLDRERPLRRLIVDRSGSARETAE